MATRVALVTGGSAGIGESTAKLLHEKKFVVYAAARRTELMKPLADRGVHTLKLDVTDEDSMTACVEQVLEDRGRIDVLVNNAGYGSYGAIEDVPLEEARRQFEVNIFGLARMTQLVLPAMRRQHTGTIVNISSMAGRIYTPMAGWYHASKHALEGLSDCLRLELAPFGIDVVVIQPGGIKTDWGLIAAEHLEQRSAGGPYQEMAGRSSRWLRRNYTGSRLTSPDVVAKTVLTAVTATRPHPRYAVGLGAKPSIALRKVLPDRAFDALVKRI